MQCQDSSFRFLTVWTHRICMHYFCILCTLCTIIKINNTDKTNRTTVNRKYIKRGIAFWKNKWLNSIVSANLLRFGSMIIPLCEKTLPIGAEGHRENNGRRDTCVSLVYRGVLSSATNVSLCIASIYCIWTFLGIGFQSDVGHFLNLYMIILYTITSYNWIRLFTFIQFI